MDKSRRDNNPTTLITRRYIRVNVQYLTSKIKNGNGEYMKDQNRKKAQGHQKILKTVRK